MEISFITLDRTISEQIPPSEIREKKLLRDSRKLSDSELLKKLGSFGIELTHVQAGELFSNSISSQELSCRLQDQNNIPIKDFNSDWIWLCLTVLWERWFPEIPHLESLDDQMQNGYKIEYENHGIDVVYMWNSYWQNVKWMMKKWKITTIADFDEKLPQTQILYNWIGDFDMSLSNAALVNSTINPLRLQFLNEVIPLIDSNDKETLQMFRSSLAETHFKMGNIEIAEKLFKQLTNDFADWCWGWIHWADCYSLDSGNTEYIHKAESILLNFAKKCNSEDIGNVYERLLHVYESLGDTRNITKYQELITAIQDDLQPAYNHNMSAADKSNLNIKQKNKSTSPGRNDPCPCGSGKKYKKCCINN